MKRVSFVPCVIALLLIATGCKTEKNYITNNTGPKDWQPPVLTWHSLPDAEVRGTVGLDVTVTDSSAIPMVKLYVDGGQRDSLTAAPYRFSLNTDSLVDGVHLCEARAWDQYGNLGISPVLRVNVMNSVAQGPRLIWVPDSFATIQAAINAATDFDTIRVRDGTYVEALNPFGKGIWLESQHGSLRCTLNNAGSNSVIYVTANVHPITVRGFRMEGPGYLINLREGSQANFYDNIVFSDSGQGTLFALYCAGNISNNLFVGSQFGAQIGYMWGDFSNNVVEDAQSYGLWNMSDLRNPLVHAYDLFWNNATNYGRFDAGTGDLDADPMLDLINGRPLPGSPVVDAGDPQILDSDGSRSDIGPFGGPWAYHN